MLIVCPSCALSYALTPEQLGRGRTLRCAQCRHTWFATPADAVDAEWAGASQARRATDASAALAEADMAFAGMGGADMGGAGLAGFGELGADQGSGAPAAATAPPRKPVKAAPRRKNQRPSLSAQLQLARAKLAKTWPAVAAGLLVALLALGVAGRQTVVRMAPASARIFAAIGLPVNLRGLAFEGLRGQIVAGKDQSVLVVEGAIRNIRKQDMPVPPLAVTVRDSSGAEVYHYTAEPPQPALAPGESLAFTARASAPPLDGHDVVVRFARTETGVPAAHGAAHP